ncbi:MAG: hypothetical protein MMC33_008690 [Icmadophila ericetorum]|nr:hypothetical protein [Icmadophila ericetorum]
MLEKVKNQITNNTETISQDGEALPEIQEQIVSILLPPEELFAKSSEFDLNPHVDLPKSKIRTWHQTSATGFEILSELYSKEYINDSLHLQLADSPDLLTTTFAYSSLSDPWTSPSTFKLSQDLLQQIKSALLPGPSGPEKYSHLLTSILKDAIKPLFSKSKPQTITEAGRKSAFPEAKLPPSFSEESSAKPWKYAKRYIVSVYGGVLSELSRPEDIESNWPLLIPPLLTLLDDSSTALKVRGCEFLRMFLGKVQPELLQRTGLGDVFWETLMPCLSYLPTLTPEDESLELLGAVYPTLLELVRVRFAHSSGIGNGNGNGKGPETEGEKREEKVKKAKLKALDEVLRKGVLHGYAHVGTDHVKIGNFLVERMGEIVYAMGIQAVRHLKDIIPLLTSILASPFSTAYPPLLLTALSAFSTVILNCWPRIPFYRGEILKGTCVPWLRAQEDESSRERLSPVEDEIKEVLSLLRATVENVAIDWVEEISMLIAAKPELKELFET